MERKIPFLQFLFPYWLSGLFNSPGNDAREASLASAYRTCILALMLAKKYL